MKFSMTLSPDARNGAVVLWTPAPFPPSSSSLLTSSSSASSSQTKPNIAFCLTPLTFAPVYINRTYLQIITQPILIRPVHPILSFDHTQTGPKVFQITPVGRLSLIQDVDPALSSPLPSSPVENTSDPSPPSCPPQSHSDALDIILEDPTGPISPATPPAKEFVNPLVRKRPLPPDSSPSPKRVKESPTIVLPYPTPVSDRSTVAGNQEEQWPSQEPPHRAADRGKEVEDNSEKAKVDQWKVGKRPGFQGSYVISEDTKKRTLSESISSTAERVLKKPFRPPFKIVVARVKKSEPPIDPSSSSPSGDTSITSPSSRPQASVPIEPFPLDLTPSSSKPRPVRIQRQKPSLVKPFKTPARVDKPTASNSRGRSYVATTGGISLAPAKSTGGVKSTREKLREVNEKIANLKKALYILNHPLEDEAIRRFIVQWTEAGQEITDRLFKMVDKSEEGRHMQPHRTGWATSQDDGFLTAEQQAALDAAGRNENGEAIDDEGNLLMDWEGFGDLDKMLEDECRIAEKRDKNKEYVPQSWMAERPAVDPRVARYNADPTAWNHGIMLFRMGFQPEVLGWDQEAEDWREAILGLQDSSQSL